MLARHRARWLALGSVLAVLACAPIEVESQVELRPVEAPQVSWGEQLVERDFTADYVQLGPRVLVELRVYERCARPRHQSVLRVERVRRSSAGFVAWDFALGSLAAGFGALAFARPQLFSQRLIDGQGRRLENRTGAYVTGGVFVGVGALLLTIGIIDAVRARDEVRYAEAYQVELGALAPCASGVAPAPGGGGGGGLGGEGGVGGSVAAAGSGGAPLAERELVLVLDDGRVELSGSSDGQGRAHFVLPAAELEATEATVPAVLKVRARSGEGFEAAVLVLRLRAPWGQRRDAHTGRADTREVEASAEDAQ